MTDLGLNAIVLEKVDIGRMDLLFLMFALFKDNCFFLFFFTSVPLKRDDLNISY